MHSPKQIREKTINIANATKLQDELLDKAMIEYTRLQLIEFVKFASDEGRFTPGKDPRYLVDQFLKEE